MMVMRTCLGSLAVVLSLMACGGTSDSSNQTGGGSSAGGTSSAGHNSGAGTSAGGKAGNTSGGSSSSAGTGGRIEGTSGGGVGGTMTVGGTGTGGVDARCPAKRPMGACSADDAGLACQYDNSSGCLCYPNAPGTFTPCQKVDPTCAIAPTGAAPAPGAGGSTAKIALPPMQICRCASSTWTCSF